MDVTVHCYDDRVSLAKFPRWHNGKCAHPFRDYWVWREADWDGVTLITTKNHDRIGLVSRRGGLPLSLRPRKVCNCKSAWKREQKLAQKEKRRPDPQIKRRFAECSCPHYWHVKLQPWGKKYYTDVPYSRLMLWAFSGLTYTDQQWKKHLAHHKAAPIRIQWNCWDIYVKDDRRLDQLSVEDRAEHTAHHRHVEAEKKRKHKSDSAEGGKKKARC